MARNWCDHCERHLFGIGPWHDEDCDAYAAEPQLRFRTRAYRQLDMEDE